MPTPIGILFCNQVQKNGDTILLLRNCGQNAYTNWNSNGPSRKKSLSAAVDSWYSEIKDFDKADVNGFGQGTHTGVVGHYTQVRN